MYLELLNTLNSRNARLSRSWSILGILASLYFSVSLWCHPFGERNTLKNPKIAKELLNMHSIYIYIYMCIHICKNIESERFILLLVFVRGTACPSVKIYRKMAEPEIALSGSSIFIQMGNQVLPFYIYRKIAEARRGLLLIAFVPERACLSAYSTCTIHIYTYMYICIYIYI